MHIAKIHVIRHDLIFTLMIRFSHAILCTYTDVAEMVLNKCTSTNTDRNIRSDSEEFAVTFDYQFLEDREKAALLVNSDIAILL